MIDVLRTVGTVALRVTVDSIIQSLWGRRTIFGSTKLLLIITRPGVLTPSTEWLLTLKLVGITVSLLIFLVHRVGEHFHSPQYCSCLDSRFD